MIRLERLGPIWLTRASDPGAHYPFVRLGRRPRMAQVLGRGLGMPFAVSRQYLGPARLAVDSRSEHERRHIRAALRRAHDRLLEDPSDSCSHRKPF